MSPVRHSATVGCDASIRSVLEARRTLRERRERLHRTRMTPTEHRSTSQWLRLKSDRLLSERRELQWQVSSSTRPTSRCWRRRRRCGGRDRGPRCRRARHRLREELRTRRCSHHLRRWLSDRRIAIAATERYLRRPTRSGPATTSSTRSTISTTGPNASA